MNPVVTLLYAPGDRPELMAKALRSDADVVLLDLEDAVAPARKGTARDAVAEALAGVDGADRPVQVRLNGRGTPWYDDDVALVASLPPAVGARLPKVESAAQVREAAAALGGRALHLLLESALGVERAFELAGAAATVASLGLGEADLRSDLRCDDDGLAFARAHVVLAARAAGLPSPAMSVYPHVRDLDGLVASCRAGRAQGFCGRAAIHPSQLEPIRQAFAPAPDEVTWGTPAQPEASPARPQPARRAPDDEDVGWGAPASDSNDDRLTRDRPPHW